MHPTQKPLLTTDGADESPAHTLRAAALYLDDHGWIQGAYYATTSPSTMFTPAACALGAIAIVVHGTVVDCPESSELPGYPALDGARQALTTSLNKAADIPPWEFTIGEWNDQSGRTVEQVIQACRNAADAYDRAHTTGGAA